MVEDIKLDTFPKSSGVYIFKSNDEVIYVGSSKNLYKRMSVHNTAIKKGSAHGYKQDLYQYLQSNHFIVEFQLTDDYRQLEQKLVEKYNPKYNAIRAYTGCGAYKGRVAEYSRERYQKYKEKILEQTKQRYEANREEILEQKKQYRESHREEILEQMKQYRNQLCFYNGETLTLDALRCRFRRQDISNPTTEAKKYIIKESNNPIEFYDVYP